MQTHFRYIRANYVDERDFSVLSHPFSHEMESSRLITKRPPKSTLDGALCRTEKRVKS
jgi:hypothetical protein